MDETTTQSASKIPYIMSGGHIRRTQLLSTPLFRGLAYFLRSRTVILLDPSDIDHDHTYIIVTNHQSRIDPFMISGSFPVQLWWKLMPITFFAHNGLLRNPFNRLILMSFGCFPTQPLNDLPYGLKYAEDLIAEQRTILIFPEGKRAVKGMPAKKGVTELAKAEGVMILPCFIGWRHNKLIRRFDFVAGKPFQAENMSPDEIMEHVYSLENALYSCNKEVA